MRSGDAKVKGDRGARVTRTQALLLGTIACAALALALGARDLDVPGLYYDEVIQKLRMSSAETPPTDTKTVVKPQ